MPFTRPTLTDLKADAAADITSGIKGADGLLRFSNLNVLGIVVAGFSHLHYGYLDYIAKQSNPYTAEDEFLQAWAALKKVFPEGPTTAGGSAAWPGTAGTVLLAGSEVSRGDGVTYAVVSDAVVDGTGTVTATIVATGKGSAWNCAQGTQLTLTSAVAGIQSTGLATTPIVGGTDIEDDDSLRDRMLLAYQQPVQGGSAPDYISWTRAVPGITRAWVAPNGFGTGTVVVYFMMDEANAAFSGFPQGTDGVSQFDEGPKGLPRGTVATGDQLTVANALIDSEPVTALVYAVAPKPNAINFVIDGLENANTAVRAAIKTAIADVLFSQGVPKSGSNVDLSAINSGIAAIAGTAGFVIQTPSDNIPNETGFLPVVGNITYPDTP